MENQVNSTNQTQKKKSITKTRCIGIAILLTISIALVVILSFNSADNKMNKALDTNNAYEVNSLYSQAFGNDSKLEKYDEAISLYLDKVIENLNNKEYSDEDLAEYGYTVVYRDLESDWGDLIYSEEGYDTIQPSISYYNQSKWEKIQNIIKSRVAYCSGFAYREKYKQPQEAIDFFKLVTEEDSYYSRVNDELAKCVDLYVEQTLSEAQKLIDNDDISDAISKIDSINTYLENNGLTSDEVQEKLIEVKNKYAEKYVEKAENCFKEKDINGAIGNIEVAIELVPDNANYKSKKDTYKMYLPYYFYIKENCLSIEEEGDFWGNLAFDQTYTSNDNKEMAHCIKWYNNNSDADVSIVANYNLSGNYDVVSGKIFLPDGDKDTAFSGYFKVYGDGKLLYTSPKITKNVLPQDIKFTVTGVQRLKINFYGQGTGGFLSTSPDFCVSNLTAQKNFPDDKT